ncbi:MAG TPA: hypothetical protein VGY76_10535 [Solirubrobacteraceae bacterium]|jgi:hypothetical protein|nr:hypothetical protein [Solirubrobacteraceae bacterium]
MADAQFVEELPDDPRRSGWGQEWHAPDGRVSHIQEVAVAGILRIGQQTEALAAGDFIVWQDGEYKAVPHDEIMNGSWDQAGPSAIEFDALAEQEGGTEGAASE